jgi:ABC-type multidrug transport system fused ATPase/permease subunit
MMVCEPDYGKSVCKGAGMNSGRDNMLSRVKWMVIYLGAVVLIAILVLLVFSTNVFQAEIPQLAWFLGGVVLLVTIIFVLARVMRILEAIEENGTKLERIAEALNKNRAILSQIEQSVRLSEAAKAIAFRDADQQSLREVVFDEAAYQVIGEVSKRPGYEHLGEQLREEVDAYRDAGEQQRIKQLAGQIEQFFEQHQWVKAAAEIDKLTKTYPKSEDVKALRQKLIEKKEERKKVLLTAWDDAVQRGATDRSIEILRELDMYLAPNEALALQEAARDVFKSKLHNLGVQFSLAVSGQRWAKAVEIGQQIVRDFPNSKMAGEIRQKIGVLKEKASPQAG